MQVLLLEPDFWRFLGISQVLESEPGIKFLGEQDYARVLAMTSTPADLRPEVVIVSHSLIIDYRISVVEHLRRLFPNANLLVDGYDKTLDAIAEILQAGAKGYFLLSSEPPKLLTALNIVGKGFIWAPREAVVLLAGQQGADGGSLRKGATVISAYERSILRLLEQGLSNKQIAQKLEVAEATIKGRLTKLYRRFGVRTRLELLAYAVSHRLIPEPIGPPPIDSHR